VANASRPRCNVKSARVLTFSWADARQKVSQESEIKDFVLKHLNIDRKINGSSRQDEQEKN